MGLLFVSASRMSETEFAARSLLAKSLASVSVVTPLTLRLFAENSQPLADCYNQVIEEAKPDDVLVFVHDDVHLDDWLVGWRVQEALQHFDVIGIAGNRRRQHGQETWYLQPGQMINGVKHLNQFDSAYLSGMIQHGQGNDLSISEYGPTPMPVKLIDGVFMAARAGRLQQSGLRFDSKLAFHFYDLDFCRTAEQLGLKIGTWPIAITHVSKGESIHSQAWNDACEFYFAKWGEYLR